MLKSLGFHDKPLALLNVGGFFDGLSGFLRDVVAAGFMKPALLDGVIVAEDPEALAASLFEAIAGKAAP
jgi:predicted Rossmann-fold nucleotide-binding protein